MTRKNVELMKEWAFHLGDVKGAENPDFDDEEWRLLDLPHDWSIEGQFLEFRDENWAQFQNLDYRIGYLPQGIGWYRKNFTISREYDDKIIKIQFDGVYRNSDVWINGHHLGHRPYGYISFYYDLTPYIKYGKNNVIVVKVNNTGVSSRWYAGSGIYRKVFLTICDSIHVDQWGTRWTTPRVSKENAIIKLDTTILNEQSSLVDNLDLITEIYDDDTLIVENVIQNISFQEKITQTQKMVLKNPKLWSPDHPHLYKIKTTLKKEDEILDEYFTPLGIRYFRFDPNEGFFLNDNNVKFKGVCLHHDNGCLGSKLYRSALRRKLKILQTMGCNAIRTSHNPPSQEMLDLCDEMGFLVMDEVFDEWTRNKTPEGYWKYFDEWYEQDVQDFVRRDRNHPSVIIWSCGNEVPEQKYPGGVEVLKKLLKVFKREDPTRPVTQGCNNMAEANEHGFAQLLDIAGYNYYGDRVTGPKWGEYAFRSMYDDEHERYPDRILIGSENCSAFLTRGVYHHPIAMNRWGKSKDDYYCSAYDITSEVPLMNLMTRPYVCGMFTWEGFDYIGEPTPYKWPARSSYFGIVDLCGFPKDTYYLYKSQWTDEPMIHILPHWNWNEGENIEVWIYTNCESAELFLNGVSLGEESFLEDFDDVLHIVFNVQFKPGELRAVGKTKGEEIVSTSVLTAGPPHHISLEANKEIIEEEGDIIFIAASVCDKDRIIVPNSHNLILFKVNGLSEIIGLGNGNPISHEPFCDQQRHAFNGLALAVLKPKDGIGNIKIQATSAGLLSDTIKIKKII